MGNIGYHWSSLICTSLILSNSAFLADDSMSFGNFCFLVFFYHVVKFEKWITDALQIHLEAPVIHLENICDSFRERPWFILVPVIEWYQKKFIRSGELVNREKSLKNKEYLILLPVYNFVLILEMLAFPCKPLFHVKCLYSRLITA